MSEPQRTEIEVEVRYAETDQMGVVHHSNYLVWLELARTRQCEEAGFHYSKIEALGYYLVVTGCQVSYRRPARYGDRVRVTCWIERLGSRGMRFAYEVAHDGEILATASTDHVWLEATGGRPCRVPEALRPGFDELAGRS